MVAFSEDYLKFENPQELKKTSWRNEKLNLLPAVSCKKADRC